MSKDKTTITNINIKTENYLNTPISNKLALIEQEILNVISTDVTEPVDKINSLHKLSRIAIENSKFSENSLKIADPQVNLLIQFIIEFIIEQFSSRGVKDSIIQDILEDIKENMNQYLLSLDQAFINKTFDENPLINTMKDINGKKECNTVKTVLR